MFIIYEEKERNKWFICGFFFRDENNVTRPFVWSSQICKMQLQIRRAFSFTLCISCTVLSWCTRLCLTIGNIELFLGLKQFDQRRLWLLFQSNLIPQSRRCRKKRNIESIALCCNLGPQPLIHSSPSCYNLWMTSLLKCWKVTCSKQKAPW